MKNQKITLGFSPCPNDTFIFDAMVHYKIDTEGLEFEVFMGDVEELNHKAFRSELDITKLSYHAFAHLISDYQLLNSGSALGQNCGPLLVSKLPQLNARNSEIQVAIPGKYTTANFLLSLAYPEITNKVELIFSDIEQAVIDRKVDAGLIIHENRFTYQDKGLIKIKKFLDPNNKEIKNKLIEINYEWASKLSWDSQSKKLLDEHILHLIFHLVFALKNI